MTLTNQHTPKRKRIYHGYAKTSEHNIWKAMFQRCYNPNDKAYVNYGGRGITICERWNDFRNFIGDMGKKLKEYSLERLDNNKGYNPKNCVWANRLKQNWNKRCPKNNTSGHKGISFKKETQLWYVYITVRGERKHLGYRADYEEALKLRKLAEKKYGFTQQAGE